MTSLASIGAVVGKIVGITEAYIHGKDKNISNKKSEAFAEIAKNYNVRFGFGKEDSITAELSKYIIEPTIFVSKDVGASCPDVKDKAIGECIDLFVTFFSQCFHVLVNVETDDDISQTVKLMGTTNKNHTASSIVLNTAAELGDMALNNSSLVRNTGNNESVYKDGFSKLKKAYDQVGMESLDMAICDLKNRDFLTFEPGVEDLKNKLPGVDMPKEQISMGFHIRSFEVSVNVPKRDDSGKVVNTTMIRIPFVVRANIVELNVDHMCYGIKPKTNDNTFWKRWHKWRSGAISFWRDFVFCSDLIEQNKKDRVKDKSGTAKKIDYAKYNSRISSGDITRATYERFYNMFILTPADLNKIYQVERGDIHNPSYKESLFEKLNALMLLSLDPEWEMGELFIKDLKGVSTIKFDNIGKRKGGGMDGDIATLFKSLYASNAPAF